MAGVIEYFPATLCHLQLQKLTEYSELKLPAEQQVVSSVTQSSE